MPDHRETIRRLNEDVFGKGNLDIIDELVHEDYVDHTAMPGVPADRDGLKAFVQITQDAVSDQEVSLDHVLVDGDKVAYRWTMRGTHTGEFMGIPATDKTVTVTGNDIAIMRDGKIAETWGEWNMFHLLTELGAVESPFGG